MGKLIKFALVVAVAYGAYVMFIQPDWYPAGSAEDGFTVEFPGQPERQSNRSRLKHLGLTTVTSYAYQKGNTGFSVVALSSKKIRDGKVSKEQINESAIDRLAKQISGRLVSAKDGTHKGVAYTELEYRIDGSAATMYLRVFAVDGKILVFLAGSHTMERMTSGRGRFFKSIRFPGA